MYIIATIIHIISIIHPMMITVLSIHLSVFDCSKYSTAEKHYKIMYLKNMFLIITHFCINIKLKT